MRGLQFRNGNFDNYTIVLSSKNYRHLGQLTGVRDVNEVENLDRANEFSFTVCKYDLLKYDKNSLLPYDTYIKIMNNLWNQIVDFKLIWVKELDEYYEIKVSTVDAKETTKSITAKSLCEAELSQIDTGSIEINTPEDIERKDYYDEFPTVFYRDIDTPELYDEIWTKDENKYLFTLYFQDSEGNILLDENGDELIDEESTCNLRRSILRNSSLLHRIFDGVPHYKIGDVAPSLWDIQRTFSIDTTIYDFLTGDCSEQINCLFQFDSKTRTVDVYDLYTVCNNCDKRGDFSDECPDCHSTDLYYFGEDTTILVDKNNLTDEIRVETNADNLKNCFRLVAGDDLMSETIRMLNPNGSNYIYHFSENQLKDMSKELRSKLCDYNDKVASASGDYEKIVTEIYDYIDKIEYLKSEMMPKVSFNAVTAESEAQKLTQDALSFVALSDLDSDTLVGTVNTAIINYAKTLVKTGYVKLEIIQSENVEPIYTYVGTNKDDKLNYALWSGRIRVTNYSDKEDVVETNTLVITINNNYEEYINQRVLKELSKDDDDNIFVDLLSADYDIFKVEIKKYCLNRLISFGDALEGALNVLTKMNQSQIDAEFYTSHYLPYYEKFKLCQEEQNIRQGEINSVETKMDNADSERMKMQNDLDLKTNLGEHYLEFCSYRREQKYTNDNFISDGLNSNTELISYAKQFIEKANSELIKASETQYTISSSLYNFLAIPAFKRISKNFKLGNWIRLKADGSSYRLRLISRSGTSNSPQSINVTFSTVTKIKDVAFEAQQIIKSAQSISSSFGYVKHQAVKGQEAKKDITDWKQNSLNSALVKISNNENEEVTMSKQGILCRSFDDVTGTYDDKQLKLTHNLMAFTDNNWKTCRQAIGEHSYEIYDFNENDKAVKTGYGITADFVNSGTVLGSKIFGGEIYSDNFKVNQDFVGKEDFEKKRYDCTGTFIDLQQGLFSFAGRLIWDGKDLKINRDDVLNSLKEADIVVVDGTLRVKAENIDTTTALIKPNQIEVKELEIDATQIKGDVHVNAENIDTTTALIQPEQIAINDIKLDISQVSGTIGSDRITDTLSNKTLSGSFTGTINASGITTTADGTTYTGITTDVVLENQTLHFVNGLLVNVTTS